MGRNLRGGAPGAFEAGRLRAAALRFALQTIAETSRLRTDRDASLIQGKAGACASSDAVPRWAMAGSGSSDACGATSQPSRRQRPDNTYIGRIGMPTPKTSE